MVLWNDEIINIKDFVEYCFLNGCFPYECIEDYQKSIERFGLENYSGNVEQCSKVMDDIIQLETDVDNVQLETGMKQYKFLGDVPSVDINTGMLV